MLISLIFLVGFAYTYVLMVKVIPCQVIQKNGDFSSDPHQNS